MFTEDLSVGDVLIRLAVARGGLLDDVMSEVYLDKLDRFDPGLVRRACDEWSEVPRDKFEPVLPPVPDLIRTIERLAHEDAEASASRKLLPMPGGRDRDEPTFFCLDCHDEPNAWRVFWCQGDQSIAVAEVPPGAKGVAIARCGRTHLHAPHSFADKCGCQHVNPVIAAHRRKFAESRTRRDEKKR